VTTEKRGDKFLVTKVAAEEVSSLWCRPLAGSEDCRRGRLHHNLPAGRQE